MMYDNERYRLPGHVYQVMFFVSGGLLTMP